MPSNVVKTKKDEEKWEKAKELAADQGHKEEYDYIMGIYKKMKPDYFKDKKGASDPMRHIRDISDLPKRVADKALALPVAHQLAGGKGYFKGVGVSLDINSASKIGKRIRLFNNTNVLGVVQGQVRWGRAFVLHSTSFAAKYMALDPGLTARRIDDERSVWLVYSLREDGKRSSLREDVIRLAYEQPSLRKDLLPLVTAAFDPMEFLEGPQGDSGILWDAVTEQAKKAMHGELSRAMKECTGTSRRSETFKNKRLRISSSKLRVSVQDRDFQALVGRAAEGAEFLGFTQASVSSLGFNAYVQVRVPMIDADMGRDPQRVLSQDADKVAKALGKIFKDVRLSKFEDDDGYAMVVQYEITG